MLRSAGVLIGGTCAAQVLTVAVLHIPTWVYYPQEFSLLASVVGTQMALGNLGAIGLSLGHALMLGAGFFTWTVMYCECFERRIT